MSNTVGKLNQWHLKGDFWSPFSSTDWAHNSKIAKVIKGCQLTLTVGPCKCHLNILNCRDDVRTWSSRPSPGEPFGHNVHSHGNVVVLMECNPSFGKLLHLNCWCGGFKSCKIRVHPQPPWGHQILAHARMQRIPNTQPTQGHQSWHMCACEEFQTQGVPISSSQVMCTPKLENGGKDDNNSSWLNTAAWLEHFVVRRWMAFHNVQHLPLVIDMVNSMQLHNEILVCPLAQLMMWSCMRLLEEIESELHELVLTCASTCGSPQELTLSIEPVVSMLCAVVTVAQLSVWW